MALYANEYPDIWVFSNERPSPKSIPTWVDARSRVHEFVGVFLTAEFFGRILIWEHKSWFARISHCTICGFCVLDHLAEAQLTRHAIESCSETGHMSVLFSPLKPDLFLKRIIESGRYGKPCRIEIGTGGSGDPFAFKHGYDFSFLESLFLEDWVKIFTFSHDAQALYEIFR
jgi:hypothetical protein